MQHTALHTQPCNNASHCMLLNHTNASQHYLLWKRSLNKTGQSVRATIQNARGSAPKGQCGGFSQSDIKISRGPQKFLCKTFRVLVYYCLWTFAVLSWICFLQLVCSLFIAIYWVSKIFLLNKWGKIGEQGCDFGVKCGIK